MAKIVIIGAGALGKSIAGLLAEHASITLYERNPVTCRVLAQGHFNFIGRKFTKRITVQTVRSLDKLSGQKIDVLILATKIMDLRKAALGAKDLAPRCVFLPQNGIFDIRWMERLFKNANICRGVTTMACQELGPGQVKLFYSGSIYVGGDGAPLIASLFRKGGVGAKSYRSPDGAVWAKLIFSAVMNPLPVVTGQGYAVLRTDENIWRLVKQAIEEGRDVARAVGVRLAFDPMKLIARVRDGDLVGIEHRGSIVHDMVARRSTELEFITGALVRWARRKNIKTPALEWVWRKAKSAGA